MKPKHLQLIGLFVILTVVLSSCWFLGPSVKGNGHVTEEVRKVGEFDQIEVSRGMNVYITQGSPAKVVVVADDNLHEYIETEVHGGVLKVYVDANIRWATEKKVMVTVGKLSAVETSSGSNVWSQSQIMSDNLELKSNAGANLTLDVNAKYLTAECSSGANINLSGLAKDGKLETSSGANLKAQELKVEHCKMSASSGGNTFSTVTGALEANASSGGNVYYYGEPSSTDINTSSGGGIHRK
jgi:hypothetical protein